MRILVVFSQWVTITPDGRTRMAPETIRRCAGALSAWQTEKYDRILVVGGRYVRGQCTAVSWLMRNWLCAHGIPQDAILTEDRSVNTHENVAFGLNTLRSADIEDPGITVLSQWQHVIRIKTIFRRVHKLRVSAISLHHWINPLEWIKECVFVAYTFFDPSGLVIPRIIRYIRSYRTQR